MITETSRVGAVIRRRKWLIVWAVGVVIYEVAFGMPLSRAPVFAIIGLGLVALTAGNDRAWARVVADWLPLFAVLYAYDLLRSVADTWLTPHVYPQIEFDRFLFGGHVPTVELQRALYTPGTAHGWDYFAFLTYLTHFVVPIGVAAVLWKVAHDKFRRYVFLFVSLTFVTFLTYLFFPAVPPWMASRSGAIAPTAKIIDDMWIHVGLKSGADVFSATITAANTMLAAIALRTHEVGILLATGFRPFPIFLSFLFEALVLGLLGGVVGCLFTLPLNGMSTGTTNFETFTEVAFAFRVTPIVLVAAVGFSLVLGLIGGALPAWRAARLRPTEALRRG